MPSKSPLKRQVERLAEQAETYEDYRLNNTEDDYREHRRVTEQLWSEVYREIRVLEMLLLKTKSVYRQKTLFK